MPHKQYNTILFFSKYNYRLSNLIGLLEENFRAKLAFIHVLSLPTSVLTPTKPKKN